MEDFVYVVVLLLISAIPAIQKGIQKKSKPKKKEDVRIRQHYKCNYIGFCYQSHFLSGTA